MVINRFFKPVDYEYAPIPFQELVTLGKYYADERRQAEKELSNYIKQANEFTSLISKDVDSYNKTAFNDQVKQYINQAAANPSVMKDMSWRSGLQAAINAVDYGLLNKLKSSAESAKVYDTAVKKLAMEGKMPPGWEPNYFDTYSTKDSGVFNATPLGYETMTETIKPYLDNMKDSYIETKGGYDYYGVRPEDIATQLNAFKSDILSNPVIQRKIQRYIASGATKDAAVGQVLAEANTAGLEFARRNRTANPYSEINARAVANGKSGGGSNASAGNFWFTQSMTADANIKANNFLHAFLLNTNKEYQDLGAVVAAGSALNATQEQKNAAQTALKKQRELLSSTNFDETLRQYYNASIDIDTGAFRLDGDSVHTIGDIDAIQAGNAMLQAIPPTTIGGKYNEKITDMIQGVSDKYEHGNRMITGTNNLTLVPVKMAERNGKQVNKLGNLSKLNEALQQGKLGNVAITGAGGIIAYPHGNNSINYGYVNVEITEDALLNSGIVTFPKKDKNGNLLTENGKRAYIRYIMEKMGIAAYQEDVTESTSIVNREQESDYGDSKESKTTTTHSKRRVTKYNLQAMFDLPSTGSGLNAEMLNNSIAGEKYSDSQLGNIQNYNIMQSYWQ